MFFGFLYFCDMEKKLRRRVFFYSVMLFVFWVLLFLFQMRLTRSVYSNQRDLFEVKLDEVMYEILGDTISYDSIQQIFTDGFKQFSINEPFDVGIYNTDDSLFLVLSENADEELLMESGFQYSLLCVTDEAPRLDIIYLSFPGLDARFRRNRTVGYTIMIVLLVVLFLGFVSIIYENYKTIKINTFREKMGHFLVHELKTPITTINLSTQFLLDKSVKKDEAITDSYLNMIVEETYSLEKLMNQVLTVFKAERVPSQPREDVSVHQVLKIVTEVFQLSLKEAEAEVHLDLKAEKDLVCGDATHLQNAFSNLVDNAIKYRNGPLQLSISTRNVDNFIEIRVADNGIGIKKADQKLIFDDFVRFNNENQHYVKGYGLGLSYVKHIVDFHNGTIGVESDLNHGACFILTLPLKI